jgi:hypothetical protein
MLKDVEEDVEEEEEEEEELEFLVVGQRLETHTVL